MEPGTAAAQSAAALAPESESVTSLGTLLGPLEATGSSPSASQLWFPPPCSFAPMQNPSRRVTVSRESCTELGDAEGQHSPLAGPACQIKHFHLL